VYTLPGAQLANGEIVSATEQNQFRNDVATALNTAWTRDGQAPATANIPMGSHKFTGLAAGTGNGDSVRFEQLVSSTNPVNLATQVTGTLPVANGGTGVATLTGIVKADGTNAFAAATAGTDYAKPATASTWTASQRGTLTTDNDGSFDQSVTNNFVCTPTGTFALTFTNHTAGQSGYVLLVNTGGYAITAAATTKVGASFLSTVSAAGTYIISYLDNGTNAYCTTSGALS
jgi:hypothetical protein